MNRLKLVASFLALAGAILIGSLAQPGAARADAGGEVCAIVTLGICTAFQGLPDDSPPLVCDAPTNLNVAPVEPGSRYGFTIACNGARAVLDGNLQELVSDPSKLLPGHEVYTVHANWDGQVANEHIVRQSDGADETSNWSCPEDPYTNYNESSGWNGGCSYQNNVFSIGIFPCFPTWKMEPGGDHAPPGATLLGCPTNATCPNNCVYAAKYVLYSALQDAIKQAQPKVVHIVDIRPDLAVTLNGPTTVSSKDPNANYTVVIANQGDTAANGLILEVTFPLMLSPQSVISSLPQMKCTAPALTFKVSCSGGKLEGGQQATVVVYTRYVGLPTSKQIDARVSTTDKEKDAANDTNDDATLTVTGS